MAAGLTAGPAAEALRGNTRSHRAAKRRKRGCTDASWRSAVASGLRRRDLLSRLRATDAARALHSAIDSASMSPPDLRQCVGGRARAGCTPGIRRMLRNGAACRSHGGGRVSIQALIVAIPASSTRLEPTGGIWYLELSRCFIEYTMTLSAGLRPAIRYAAVPPSRLIM